MTEAAFSRRTRPEPGLRLVHRRYVDHGAAHYAGNLASGAYVVGLFGDIATDLCVQTDRDEGLFASYTEITFHGALRAGDVIEVSAELTAVGTRSRTIAFSADVVSRSSAGDSVAGVFATPLRITSAVGTVVVPTAYDGNADG